MGMKIGMLWFDNNPRMDIHGKIALARAYYQTKYGKVANLVFVHPSMVTPVVNDQGENVIPEKQEFLEYDIRTNRSVMPNHFWVGVDAELTKQVVETQEPVVDAAPVKPIKPAKVKPSQRWDTLEF